MVRKLYTRPRAGAPQRSPAKADRLGSFRGANLWLSLALVFATFAVYARVAQFSFVNYDDPDYAKAITVTRAFTSTEAANWFPITRLSHSLDVLLFGMDAGWHHLTSVAIHAVAAVLLFLFLLAATGTRGPSAFVAFVFALHPLHVESVAWVAERKDVLCAFFWFLALWAYVRRKPWLVLAAFLLGLMSKPMIVTLPFVLLLLDFWPLKRGLRVREKLPLFALAAAGAAVTYFVQHAAGAVKPVGAPAITNALLSYVWYIGKTLWPAGLACFYPYPAGIPLWQAILAAAVLAAVTAAVLRAFPTRPYLAVGWFWFLGTLVPVIGLVQVGAQAHADRYMYVPMVGLAVMAAWGTCDLMRSRPRILAPLAAAVCLACAVASWVQTGYWQNSGALFSHALEVTDGNYIAEHNLGSYLMDQHGQLESAVAHLRRAVELRPDSGPVHSDLGSALAKSPGGLAEAIAELQTAVRLLPDSPIPRENLAHALVDAAQQHYQSGMSLAHAGRATEATAEFSEALRLDPSLAEAHNNLGVVLSQIPGRGSEAIAHFREALRLRPDYEDARYNLNLALHANPVR
ncbi:MAG TPA: tetratricopeptide repeat protein [Bryobacteraceae bacterium]|nr:tetratricopeptide repeat protein [Bryobacteraceae bacterium]